ncbi:hypothetical protein [Paraglaciecola sp. MB-3u-78]|uniref:hypothetical protein n=1 Tax=Paraglaciecola sp. MB-3u-78 TaxID=2058332 RepID=UPI0018E3DD4E|nr:hypothetical protein [Paraglaciecola sp. MB-3u-78]
MKLEYSFAEELTALGSEVKPIKLINSRLAVFNHSLATELNLPSEWQHESHLFNAMFAKHGVLNHSSMALKKPYEDIDEYQKFSALPPDWGKELEISCSS